MTDDRWVVLGLAHPRAGWFGELSRWSTTAAIPVDFVKCVSPDEVRARLTGGRAYSALLVGSDVVGLDRDLVDRVRENGAAVIVVGSMDGRDWQELGVAAVLPAMTERGDLLTVLREHAMPVPRITSALSDNDAASDADPDPGGHLIAVAGPGGTGTSIVAMSLAQAFADTGTGPFSVVLADLALDADQHVLHDCREVMPGIQELVEAHRTGTLPVDQVRSLTFDAIDRGYDLLLGLRRHRDWTAIGPRAFTAALDGLRRSYQVVVADIESDLEGEALTGSIDVEDRNAMSRTTATRADLVVVVGSPSTKGLHALSRTIRQLVEADVDPAAIVPVCNRSSRRPRRRAGVVAALATLVGADPAARIGNPVFLSERSDIEDSIRDGARLPPAFGRHLHDEVRRRLDDRVAVPPASGSSTEPHPVTAGSLAHWTETAD